MSINVWRAIRYGGMLALLAALVRPAAVMAPARILPGRIEIGLRPWLAIPRDAGPPLDLTSAGDGSGRLFIAARKGVVYVADAAGRLRRTPFLDMPAAGVRMFDTDEGGFCGLAFAPNYGRPPGTPGAGKFYTFTTEAYDPSARVDFSHPELRPAGPLTPADQVVVREWSVDPHDPNRADPASARVLMRINHPGTTHHGGGLAFGPDGCLYVALGDGGGGNDKFGGSRIAIDGHTDAAGNAQDLSNVFGKILRIDPLGTGSPNGQYGIPADNPFAHRPGAVAEIYAYGLRNPYRISFDPATGRLYAGDVGQSNREEVDAVRRGGNYGWPFREGTLDNTRPSGTHLPGGVALADPFVEYTHRDGMAVIGGYVYRGSAVPGLAGRYVFGDYLRPPGGGRPDAGRLFYARAGRPGPAEEFRYAAAGPGLLEAGPPEALLGLGRDEAGELYALFDDGQVARIVAAPPGK